MFKKKKKEEKENSFAEPQEISGGNLYSIYNKLKVQKDIDLSNLPSKNMEQINNIVSELNKKYVNALSINDYHLLLLHSNYFTNTIIFNCNNYKLKRIIINIIRTAWLNGRAGLYFNKKVNKCYAISISNVVYSIYGDIEKIEYYEYNTIENINPEQYNKEWLKTIEGKECENVAIFNWGALHLSAYILYFPFVKYQNNMLKTMIALSFCYNKKFGYNISNPEQILSELELWYNPANPFIIYNDEVIKRFKVLENTTDGALDFISYYKEAIGAFYAMFGRRMNLDFKKERNTVEEVSLTSGAIENVERDWLIQFEIFIENVLDLNNKLKMWDNLIIDNIKLNNWENQEREEGIFRDGNNNDNGEIK